jgi:hypothetical protein
VPTASSGSPIAIHIACFSAIVKDEPELVNDVTLDADSTMISPRVSSRAVVPSTRW